MFIGSFLIEVFFSIPGLGREILLAVNRSDYPVIQAVTIYLAVLTMLINLTADILYKVVDPRVVQMIPSATIESIRIPPEPTRSRGVWVTAWRRLKNDRVGVVSLVIVAAFALLVLLSFLGIVAGDWQKEVAVPDAPPTFLGLQAAQTGTDPLASVIAKDAKPVDLTDIDPLWRPSTKSGKRVPPRYRSQRRRAPTRCRSAPIGSGGCARQSDQGCRGLDLRRPVRSVAGDRHRHDPGALSGYIGGKVGDFLEWVYNVFTSIPDILLIFAFAAVLGRGITTVI